MSAQETFKESVAKIKRQMEHNITLRRDMKDEMNRGIGKSDYLLSQTLGADNAANLVAQMVESAFPAAKGFDPLAESGHKFSLRKTYNALCEMEDQGRLREAGAETTYGALLRLGVTNIMAKAFKDITSTYVWDKVIMTTASQGLYNVLGSTFLQSMPQFVGAGEEFAEVSVSPMGNIVQNVKWGQILAFQNELVDDDLTGEITQRSGDIGEAMARVQELWFAATLSYSTLSEGNLTIAPLTYNDPDGTSGVYTASNTNGRQNRPASFGAIGMQTLKTARQTLKNIQQPNGVRLMVDPNTIVYTPLDEQIVDTLLDSPNWPSSVSSADTTASGMAGASTGQAFAANPLKKFGYQRFECRLLNQTNNNALGGAWFLGQRQSRSMLYFNRDGLQVLQESPNAGKSFELDESRWRARSRGNMAWVLGGARFWYQGNNGN